MGQVFCFCSLHCTTIYYYFQAQDVSCFDFKACMGYN